MRRAAEKILATKITDMRLASSVESRIAMLCLGRTASRTEFAQYRDGLTVGAVLARFKEKRISIRESPQFSIRLLHLGLTRLEWHELPLSTVSIENFKELPRDEFFALSADFLGFRRATIDSLSQAFKDPKGILTIGKLLAFEVVEDTRLMQTLSSFSGGIEQSLKILRQVLSEDEIKRYPFMSHGGRTPEVLALAERHGISHHVAKQVLGIARKEGWVPNSPE